jgi:hypothetical protein
MAGAEQFPQRVEYLPSRDLILKQFGWRVFQLPCTSRVWAGEDFCVSRAKASRLSA